MIDPLGSTGYFEWQRVSAIVTREILNLMAFMSYQGKKNVKKDLREFLENNREFDGEQCRVVVVANF